MSVEDFPPRPHGAAEDSAEMKSWLDRLRDRQNIDKLKSITVSSADETYVFSVSGSATGKTTISSVVALGSSAPWPATTNQIVTSNATVTIPTAATRALVEMVGSGGGGAGGDGVASGGSGGGAGAYARQWFTSLTPGNTLAATVPGGGAGGINTVNGTAGSQTSLASGTQSITTLSANGGTAGLTSGTGAAAQATTSGAALTIPGSGSDKIIAAVALGTKGGDSQLGRGGNIRAAAGFAGNNYGSGGGGGDTTTGGGDGAGGVIIIHWYS